MTFKTIVTVIRGEDDGNRVLNAIAPMVARDSSHLIGVHAETTALAYLPVVGAEAVAFDEAVIEANRKRMDHLKEWFTNKTGREMASAEWRGFENYSGDSAASAIPIGFAADLIVVQQTDPGNPGDLGEDIETLLFETGRPVLVIPYTCKQSLEFSKVLVAWKDSRETARAVFDALPFLKQAENVEVLVINPEDTAEHAGVMTGADIASALDRHGVNVTINNQMSGEIPVASAVENRLSDSGVDLLVMGAYSRMRLTERIFGGVTRTILQSMTTPVLFSR